tara:strand:- start:2129 stop:2482 length:354 start_codon:yes stop_codon:yes gene_type:complete
MSKKVKASSLVETIVAATIISLVTGMGMSVFLLVSSPSSSTQSLLDAQEISAEILDTISSISLKKHEYFEYKEKGLAFEGEIKSLSEDLYSVEILALNPKGRRVYTRNRLFKVYEKD